jgi:hypothetical protein
MANDSLWLGESVDHAFERKEVNALQFPAITSWNEDADESESSETTSEDENENESSDAETRLEIEIRKDSPVRQSILTVPKKDARKNEPDNNNDNNTQKEAEYSHNTYSRFIFTGPDVCSSAQKMSVTGISVVFHCSSNEWCGKALWGWPYALWPNEVYLLFKMQNQYGAGSNEAYFMDTRERRPQFDKVPPVPRGNVLKEYPLPVDDNSTKEQLYNYCQSQASRANIVHDRRSEFISWLPWCGPKLVSLVKTSSVQPNLISWCTSSELIYMAFKNTVFASSVMKTPDSVNSMSDFFLFMENLHQSHRDSVCEQV